MTDVRTLLDETLEEVRLPVGPDPAAAWERGRRRRRARRVAIVAAVVGVVGLGAVVVRPGLPDALPPADSAPSVDRHPVRIADPWRERDLSDAPAVLAGSLSAGGGGAYGVAESGELFAIPQDEEVWGGFDAFVSNDGTKIAYLAAPTSYVVRDLGTGGVVEYAGLGDNRATSTEPFMTAAQTPGFWSPDDRHLLLWGWPTQAEGSFVLLLDEQGTIRPLRRPQDANPVGWADDSRLLWLTRTRGATRLLTTDLAGEVISRTDLPFRRLEVNQWTGSASPDGEVLFVRTEAAGHYLSVATGKRLARVDLPDRTLASCAVSWQGERALGLRYASDGAAGSLGEVGADRATVVVEGSLDPYCLLLSPRALAGGPSRTPSSLLLGAGDSWVAWHLGELALGGLGLLVLAAGVLVRRRRAAAA